MKGQTGRAGPTAQGTTTAEAAVTLTEKHKVEATMENKMGGAEKWERWGKK
jgi:hypothetical protein